MTRDWTYRSGTLRDATEANYEREVGDRSDGTDEQGAGHISCVLVHENPKKDSSPKHLGPTEKFIHFCSFFLI